MTYAGGTIIHDSAAIPATNGHAVILPRKSARRRRADENLGCFSNWVGTLERPSVESPVREQVRQDRVGPIARLLGGMKAAQTLRAEYLPDACVGEANWAMITELMLASLEGRRTPVSSLGASAGIPFTTALNHIRALTAEGILIGIPDPDDRRRTYVELAPEIAEQVEAYLQRIIHARED